MSYEVTATRRRPQQFDDLVGQEFVAETLKNSIKSQKIAHAYLFSGPRGCGKTSTARILAKALNCQNGPTDKPCCTCSNCQEITKGSSLDVIEIDGASNTGVENIRQIKDEVMFPPSNCRYKIYIIDEVHMLSNSAFNALLKTIEEPPEYVIFIFATTELQKVPATIKSRCQQYNFRLVSIDKVKACLADAAAELGIKADDEALFWIARESTGSMRDAYTLFDQVVAFSSGEITYEKIRDKLGLVGIERLNTIFEACSQGQNETVINLIDEFLQAGVSIEQLISNSADYLRSLLLIKNGIKKEALLGNSVERYSSVVLNAWNPVQIERALSIYLQLYRDIRYSLSPRYELELAFSRLCWLSQYVSNTEVKKAIDAAQALLAGAPVAAIPQSVAVQASASIPVSTANVEKTNEPAAPETTGINPIPNGLPRLSGLTEDAEDSSQQESENNTNPFSNGGPLPPEQSVAGLENGQLEETKTVEIDPRLKLNIPEANYTEDGIVPTVYIPEPVSKNDYSYNPDEDDGWANTEVPPDDSYYPDDNELMANAESLYEAQNSFVPPTKASSAQIQDTFTTADGRTMSVAQLKGSVLATLSVSDGFVANALEKTGDWKVTSDCVETTVGSQYDYSIVQKGINVINEEISRIFGKEMYIRISVKSVESSSNSNVELPEQVSILLDIFKGTIVTGKK